MSTVTNNNAGTVVYSSTYNNPFADALLRMTLDNTALPCIHNGLQVTPGTGLTINISAGTAKGQNITFTQMLTIKDEPPQSITLPTDIIMPAISALAVPDDSTGYIVLNVNIEPDPTTTSDSYNIQADNDTGPTPTVTAVFTATLSPNVESSYPYTQIVLCGITTAAGAITNIDPTVRSFDWFYVVSGGDTTDTKFTYAPQNTDWWLGLDDGTIGSSLSGADHADDKYYNLYYRLWNYVADAYCPVTTGRGSTAFLDFYANKPMNLPLSANRVTANAIGGPALGSPAGASTVALSSANNGIHGHLLDYGSSFDPSPQTPVLNSGGARQIPAAGGGGFDILNATIANSGSATPFSVVQPTVYVSQWIHL